MSKEALIICILARVSAIVWGAPGGGKTSFMTGIAAAMKRHLETVIASIREPSDFGGLPILGGTQENPSVSLAPPAWAVRLGEKKNGILFIDEASTAAPATQAALLRVTQDLVVGDLDLSDSGISVVAAANPPEQAAGGWELSPPMANRFCHLDWTVDATEWVDGIVNGFQMMEPREMPDTWEDTIPDARARIAAFIRTRPEILINVPESEAQAGKAWPSPRTWDMAARLLAAAEAYGASETTITQLMIGCVGPGPGTELLSYLENLDLPDPEEVLKDADNFKMPLRGDHQFAILSSVVNAVMRDLTEERWLKGWTVIERVCQQGAVDIGAGAARNLMLHGREAKKNLPTPATQLQHLVPILQEAGMLPGSN